MSGTIFKNAGNRPAFLRVNSAPQARKLSVDSEGRTIEGFSVITRGEALGHDFWIDEDMLDQVVAFGNRAPGGIKSRFTHPGLSADGLSDTLGRVVNFRREGNQVLADLRFLSAADPDRVDFIMGMAEEAPELFGASIVFSQDEDEAMEFTKAHSGKNGFTSPDPQNARHLKHSRVAKLFAVDLVSDPAANPAGMLSSMGGEELPIIGESVTAYLLGLSDDVPEVTLGGVHPERARLFVTDFLRRKGIDLSALNHTKEAPMNSEPEVNTPEPQVALGASDTFHRKASEVSQITTLCEIAGVEAAETLSYLQGSKPLDAIRQELRDKKLSQAKPSVSAPAQIVRDERDTFRKGAALGILQRNGIKLSADDRKVAEQFTRFTLADVARESISLASGKTVRGTNEDIYRQALAGKSSLNGASWQGGVALSGISYNHTTSDFPLILADVINKSVSAGYAEAETTYSQWVRTVPFSDFKGRYVNRLSEVNDPTLVLENGEIAETTLSEEGENYTIDTYANIISITRQTLINDDQSAFTRVPFRQGAACRRLIQKHVSNVLNRGETAAFNMSDGTPLFQAASHRNYGTTGTAFGQLTLNTAMTEMRKQLGLNGNPIAVEPRYLIIPPDLELAAYQIINATLIPTAAANLGLPNPPSIRGLIPIVDRFLSSDVGGGSATAWYLAAENGMVDTLELGLLNGIDSPAVETEEGFDVLGMRFRVFIDFGVKAIDFRGLNKRTGAT